MSPLKTTAWEASSLNDVDFLYNESSCAFVPHLCLQRFLE